MGFQLLRCNAWYARTKYLGQHAHRINGQSCRMHLFRFRPIFLDALFDKHILRHFRLRHIPSHSQRDLETILCIHGEAC